MNEPLPPVLARAPATTPPALVPDAAVPGSDALVGEFLAGRRASTLAAYRAALGDFARFLGAASPADAARRLLDAGPGGANRLVLAYKAALLAESRAPATLNLRLTAIRSLLQFARLAGAVTWNIDVRGVANEGVRDVRGPGARALRQMLSETREPATPQEVRDAALLRLLAHLGLRRGEVVSLRVEDLDLPGATIRVLGKGRRGRVAVTLPPATGAALAAWLEVRGDEPGPCFVSLRRGGALRRNADGTLRGIEGSAVHRIVGRIAADAGLGRVRPHGVRHTAVSTALDALGGDVQRVARFSRHRDVRTVLRYADEFEDVAGEVSRVVATQLGA